MSRAIVFGLFYLLLSTAYSYLTKMPEEIETQLESFRGPGGWGRMKELPKEEKERLIPWLRKEAEADKLNRDHYESELLFLGDKQALRKRATAWLEGDQGAGTLLDDLRDPSVIGLIGKGVLHPDPRPEASSPAREGVSFETGRMILEILTTAPGFESEVVEWARRFRLLFGGPYMMESREIMRDWWRANEPFFREANYAAVRPGREPKDPYAELVAARALAPASVTPALASPGPITPAAKAPAALIERQSPVWPWLVGILTLLAIVAFALKRRV